MRRRLMKLPFGYGLSYVPYRKRDPRTRLVRGDLMVELREAAGSEAPVALSLVRHDHYAEADPASRARFYPAGPPAHDLRYLDGVAFEPVEGPDGAPLPVETFEASVAKPADEWVRWGFVGPEYRAEAGWSGRGYPEMPWYRTPGGREIRSPMELPTEAEFIAAMRSVGEPVRVRGDERAAQEPAAAAATRAGLAVIGGAMWRARMGLEPHWEVIEGGDAKVRLELVLARDPLAYVHRFRLDRRDAARAFGRARAAELGRPYVETLAEIQIHDPSVLCLDEAVETARQLLAHLDWDGAGELASTAQTLRDDLVRSDEPALAGQAYALVREAAGAGLVRLGEAQASALGRFAGLAEVRPELRQEAPRDHEILAGLGR